MLKLLISCLLMGSASFCRRFCLAGGQQPREHSWLSNEEGYATADMESDQLHVPADFVWNFWEKNCCF